MAERAQIQRPKGTLSLGRRSDPAEARVATRLQQAPLRNLHEGALDRLNTGFGTDSDRVPGTVHAALAGDGQPLDSGLRSSMEQAFGEQFGDVRLHTGPAAAAAARDIDSAAFAAGNHIGFAQGAFRPDTPAGRGILAHELAHTSETRFGRDTPGIVRRVGVGEWFARLFGGGTFTDIELMRFIASLNSDTAAQEYTFQTDNMARAIVARRLHNARTHDASVQNTTLAEAANLRVRYNLIQHLLSGFSSEEDQDAVLTILDDAEQMEREQLIRTYGEEALLDRFDGARHERLATMIHGGRNAAGQPVQGTRQTSRGTVPVRWKMNYNIRNAGQLQQNIRGIAIENFQVRPDGTDGPAAWQTIRNTAMFQDGLSARDIDLSVNPRAHPKNSGGVGHLNFWVVPADTNLWGLYAGSTYNSLPHVSLEPQQQGSAPAPSAGLPYGPVAATGNQSVEATVDVELGASESGSTTTGTTTTDSRQNTNIGESERRTTRTTGSSTAVTNEASQTATNRLGETFGQQLGQSQENVRGWQEQQTWERSVQDTVQAMLQMEAQFEQETETGTETEGEVNIGAELGAQAAAELASSLGFDLGATLNLGSLGGSILGPILRRVPDPRVRALAAILQLVDEVKGALNLSISPTGRFSLTGNVNGNLRARRLWREAQRRNFQIGGQASVTGTHDVTQTQGGASTQSGQQTTGATAQVNRERQRQQELQTGQRSSRTGTTSQQLEVMNRRLERIEEQVGHQETTTRTVTQQNFVPEVRGARLSFRVVRDQWGSVTPQVPQPAQRREGG